MFSVFSIIKKFVSTSKRVGILPHLQCLLPKESEEMQQKYIADEHIRREQFKKEHPPPTIEPGTILHHEPRLLLRQWACEYNSYDISSIINGIKAGNFNYKKRFIQELALNERLRDQLEGNSLFDKWIHESKNYITVTHYNSKY